MEIIIKKDGSTTIHANNEEMNGFNKVLINYMGLIVEHKETISTDKVTNFAKFFTLFESSVQKAIREIGKEDEENGE